MSLPETGWMIHRGAVKPVGGLALPPPRPRSVTTNAEILTVLKSIERNLQHIADKLDELRVELEFTTDAAAVGADALKT